MSYFCRLLVCNILLAWSLMGCSTPGTRARAHAAAFGRVPPADQQLARHGRIHPRMSQDTVYVAWGEPDAKTTGSEHGKSASETWIYRQRLTLSEPMTSYGFNGPYHGFGDDNAARGFLPAYAYGGIGYEGVLQYQPRVRSLDAVRMVEFRGDQVDRSRHSNTKPSATNHPAVALTAKRPAGSLPHLAHRPAKSAHLAVRHRKNASAHHLSAGGGIHRSHPAAPAAKGKSGSSRLGAEHQRTAHGSRGEHGLPRGSGHAPPGASGKVRTSSA